MRLSITHLFFLAAAPAIAITGPKGPARFPLTVPRGGANNVQHLSSKTTVQQNPQVATSLKGGAQEYATSISSMRFNLVKGIVGAGVLSLPAGIAAFGDAPGAVIPAVALIIAIGMVSAYGFSLIGRVCSLTGARSYREAWEKSVGPSTSVLPAATCTFKTFVAILSYSVRYTACVFATISFMFINGCDQLHPAFVFNLLIFACPLLCSFLSCVSDDPR